MRSVQLTIALTTLAVPASAFALSPSTSAGHGRPATLPVHLSARHVRLGRPVTLSGSVARSQAGRHVELEAAARTGRAHWRELSSTRIDRGGHYRFRAHLRHSGVLRAVELVADSEPTAHAAGAAAPEAASVARTAAVSRTAAVQVKAEMRVAEREHDIIAGAQVAVSGHLLPARGNRTVAVQDRRGHRWRTVASARTRRSGSFAVRFRPAAGAGRSLRVVFRGDRANARATGAAGMVTQYEPTVASWYEDAGNTACGYHAGYGVANRTLPCGTKVAFRHAGHTVTATVDDRGPYVYGRDFDLNQTTAAALHFSGVGTVYADIQ